MVAPPGLTADAVVVGAGVGGLMTGALLSRRGRRVVVVEAADRVGGYQCRFAADGFEFEPHFHFLQEAGRGRSVRRLLDELGVDLDWRQVDPLLRLIFPDRVVTMPASRDDYLASLRQEFPHETRGIDAFFDTTRRIHAAAMALPTMSPVLVRFAGDTVQLFVARFVRDPALTTVLGGWAAYFGYGAGQISAVAIAVFTETCFDGGVLHPVGGIGALTAALVEVIERAGGSVLLSAPVTRVDTASGAATGVTLADGRRLIAPVVVSNVNVLDTLRDLVGTTAGPIADIDRFRAPFSVLLGVRAAGVQTLHASPVAVVFPGYDTDEQDRAQLAGGVEQAPVSLGVPTMLNPGLAPPDHHAVLLYTFLPESWVRRLHVDGPLADAFADRLIATADRGVPGLADHVVTRTTSLAAAGSIYAPTTMGALGWAPTPATLVGSHRAVSVLRNPLGAHVAAALTRIAPRLVARAADRVLPGVTTPIRGLYCVGQWTRTGAGMNNVCRSAALVADEIAR